MEKQKLFSISCGIAGAMVACSCAQQPEAEWKQSPNVIYILADDLGIGDISPYGCLMKVCGLRSAIPVLPFRRLRVHH